MAKNVLVTGASGYIMGDFLESLVDQETYSDVVFHVPARYESSVKEIERRAFDPHQVRILKGCDMAKPNLGLDSKRGAFLQEKIDTIIHGAASTSFDPSPEEMQKTWDNNVVGTQNLIDFAKTCKNLQKFIYFGTVFAKGKSQLVVPEGPLPGMSSGLNPDISEFNNPYEWSKWYAEREVRKAIAGGLPGIIGRSGIVLASSVDYSRFDGRMMYQYLALVGSVLRRNLREKGIDFKSNITRETPLDLKETLGENGLRLVGRNDERKNFDFIDNIDRFLQAILENGKVGETYQRVNQNWISGYQVGTALEHGLNVKGINYVGRTIENPKPNRIEEEIRIHTLPFMPYTVDNDPECVMVNTNRMLNGAYMVPMTYDSFAGLLRHFALRKTTKTA